MTPSAFAVLSDRRAVSRRLPASLFALLVVLLVVLLSGCAAAPQSCRGTLAPPAAPMPVGAPSTPAVAPTPSEQQLQAARQRYDSGDYVGAISQLHASTDLWADQGAARGEGYKLLAFSYCVTQRKAACRQAFESLLRVDPDHMLTATEIGHPIWGPVFRKMRADARKGT